MQELIRETKIKLFNTFDDKHIYIYANKYMPIDIQVQKALLEYKDDFLNAEIVYTYRLHSDDLYTK